PCTHVILYFFFQAEDGIRDRNVTGVQTCALPISLRAVANPPGPGSAEPWVPWPAGVTPQVWPTAWSGRASKTKDWRSTSTTRKGDLGSRHGGSAVPSGSRGDQPLGAHVKSPVASYVPGSPAVVETSGSGVISGSGSTSGSSSFSGSLAAVSISAVGCARGAGGSVVNSIGSV